MFGTAPRFKLLSLSAAVLCAISGSVSAENIINSAATLTSADSPYQIFEDTTINFKEDSPAVSVTDSPMTITTSQGSTLTLNRVISENAAYNDTSYSIESSDRLTLNGDVVVSIENNLNSYYGISAMQLLPGSQISTDGSLTLKANNTAGKAYGLYFKNVTCPQNFNGSLNIDVTAAEDAIGIYTDEGPSTSLPISFSGETSIKATSMIARVTGLYAKTHRFNFDGRTSINIQASSKRVNSFAVHGSKSTVNFKGITTITAITQGKNHGSHAVVADTNTQLSFSGQTLITAQSQDDKATGIDLRQSSALFNGTTVVNAYGPVSAKGLALFYDSSVTVGDNSTLIVTGETAGISLEKGVGDDEPKGSITIGKNATLITNSINSGLLRTTGNTLVTTLNDGATLRITGGKDSVSNLGAIAFNGADAAVEVGSGTYYFREWEQGSNNAVLRTTGDLSETSVIIAGKTGDSTLTLAAAGAVNDAYSSAEETAYALQKVLEMNTPETYQLQVESGKINDALLATVDKAGNLSDITVIRNPLLDAYSSIASLGVVSWRHEMNDLQKRLGELRMSPEGVGAWARLYGSEQEYGSQNVLSKSKSLQAGADTDIGNGWKVGAAFIYTDGDTHYDSGNADSDAYSLAVYGTWMNENGVFVDLIGKYTRMETDFKASSMAGSFDNNALSLSAEAGWHVKLNDQFFVEPQAEFTVGRIKGDNFTADNGVKVKQDDTDSIIGRVGVRTGYYLPDNKGTVYAHVSGVHDFDGKSASRFSYNGNSTRFTEDLGGSWVEMGVGGNYNINDKAYVYANLQKTAGGEVKENWRWNVGMRYVF